MTNSFPKTDLARLLTLPSPIRLLALLAAFRFLVAEDVATAGVVDADISRSHEGGCLMELKLQRRLTDPKANDVLALSRAGARELAAALEVEPSTVPYSTKGNAKRSAMFLDHSLARNRFSLTLASALLENTEAPKVLSWEHDRDRLSDGIAMFHESGEFRHQALEADGLMVIKTRKGVEGLLIEIDRGTEAPAYMGKKYAGYLEWWKRNGHERRFNLPAIRILTITPDKRRAARLAATCTQMTQGKAGGLFWFSSEDEISKFGILAEIWFTTRNGSLKLWS